MFHVNNRAQHCEWIRVQSFLCVKAPNNRLCFSMTTCFSLLQTLPGSNKSHLFINESSFLIFLFDLRFCFCRHPGIKWRVGFTVSSIVIFSESHTSPPVYAGSGAGGSSKKLLIWVGFVESCEVTFLQRLLNTISRIISCWNSDI